jgi:hypothetical protein
VDAAFAEHLTKCGNIKQRPHSLRDDQKQNTQEQVPDSRKAKSVFWEISRLRPWNFSILNQTARSLVMAYLGGAPPGGGPIGLSETVTFPLTQRCTNGYVSVA